MSEAVLVFPHQLFKQHPAIQDKRQIYLVEEWLFFRQYNFHKQKLMLHRSGMKYYENYLKNQRHDVHYIETSDYRNKVSVLIQSLAEQQITHIHIADTADDWLTKRIKASCKKLALQLTVYATPAFLNTAEDVAEHFNGKKGYLQTNFYTWQRRQQNILIDANGKPAGGKWTFDAENRNKFPKNELVPVVRFPEPNNYIKEAAAYVEQHFSTNYGSTVGPYYFATGFSEAEAWLSDFLKHRFQKFGIYEDAIVADETILHHSVLSPMLNTGLLTPQQIIDKALQQSEQNKIPLNSLEGFIRQLIGWREFVKIVYEREGRKQRTTNYWKFTRKIPESFWNGSTGIDPIDITIKKILKTGYAHHIERLMVLGNFMLLCEFDPDEVHRWFMEMFIDAYDWVMVPNVYGMALFADGGLMTSKPYISGSNYLMKMSNYKKGSWQQVWDGLFWRFMDVHRDFFLQNPRLGMLVGSFDKMSKEKRENHWAHATKFLDSL